MYRTIEIRWLPRSKTEWATFTATRLESARLWNDLIDRHYRIRRLNWRWPTKTRWFQWSKGKYPDLLAQSVQQIIGEFCEAIESTRQLRKQGYSSEEARYPWRKNKYRDVIYTNQSTRIRGNYLVLPNGKSKILKVYLQDSLTILGRIMETRVSYGLVKLACYLPNEPKSSDIVIGIDLGVNTLIAATNSVKSILVNGREIKSTIQWRNKKLASISSTQSHKLKCSSRYRKLQRRKCKMLEKAFRRIRDLSHKATRLIANNFPDAQAYTGEPFNDAAQRISRHSAQTVSQAVNGKLIEQLNYKLTNVTIVNEAYSSQTCSVCGARRKCARIYRCKCGVKAPRDVIGALNILSIGTTGSIQKLPEVPNKITYLRPRCRSSSAGHAGNSTFKRREIIFD